MELFYRIGVKMESMVWRELDEVRFLYLHLDLPYTDPRVVF